MAEIKIYGKLKNATESGKVADYADIDGAPEVAQETGQSTEKTMSQKAITDAINAGGGGGGSSVDVEQTTGQSTTAVMSQKAVTDELNNKVDKVTGKGLSTNDYTTIEKNKLSGIEAGAEVNAIDVIEAGTNVSVSKNGKTVTISTEGGASVPVVALTGTSGTITQAQWDMLYNSEVSFIKYGEGYMYLKVFHGSTGMTFSYFGGKTTKVYISRVIRITKSTLHWTYEERTIPTTAGCIISMQNNTASQGSTDPFYGPIFIGPGLKLDGGILSLAISSPATVYVHDIKLSTQTYAEANLGSGTPDANVLEFAFYSSEGFFNNEPTALWSYIVGNNNWIPTINGTLYGTVGGGETVRAVTKETISGTDYLCIRVQGGYGEITKYYVTEEDMIDPTKTQLVDSCREI
jgi:hypothetical protein